jgi:two-component system sensor histidine kinase KdpD
MTHTDSPFYDLIEDSQLGHLKLYIGYAAGVGKTYRMLEEAHSLQQRGVDVVLAFIETHQRQETARLLTGLEQIPRRRICYRGMELDEMNLELTLQRRPKVAIVDEIPHTNIPGSQHAKRYQDVQALLQAGISVIGALNIQHLESLSSLIQRKTSILVRETIPDAFLKSADELINLDLSVDDLLERLKTGKIYAQDKVEHALSHFFQTESLLALRELALREVAESLERTPRSISHPVEVTRGSRLMVCMSSHSPRASAMLRRGSRLAGRLNTDWYVVYVETSREAPNRIDAESQRHLYASIHRARELGAIVMQLKSDDPIQTLIHFAEEHGIGHIMIGRSQTPWYLSWWKPRMDWQIIQKAENLDIHIVGLDDTIL